MGPSLLSAPPKWDIRANPSNNEATNNRLNSCWEKLRDGEFSEKNSSHSISPLYASRLRGVCWDL